MAPHFLATIRNHKLVEYCSFYTCKTQPSFVSNLTLADECQSLVYPFMDAELTVAEIWKDDQKVLKVTMVFRVR